MISVETWKPADGLVLEPNALVAAKECVGSHALTAGPGAGKTEMLAQRADFLLRTGTCRYPKRILAISFKVDASANLKERVRRRCGGNLSARFDSHTFHAFAKRLIDRFRPVLTGNDALNADYIIGEHRIPLTQITFDDLVPLALQILETSELARNAIRQTYSDVFLDEFQDCTNSQYELIKLAFHNSGIRMIAVGDTKQKIMGWAGALEGIFVKFAHEFGAKPLNLYRNFRSRPRLLRLQNDIIKVLDPAAVMSEELIVGDGGEVDVRSFDDSEEEAKEVAAMIRKWVTELNVPASEVAVLVSKQPELYVDILMAELTAVGIPYRNEKELQDLCSEPATQLVADYLLVLFGRREPDAYLRLMKVLADGVFDEDDQSKVHNEWNRFLEKERQKAVASDQTFEVVWQFVQRFVKKLGKDRLVSLSADYASVTRLKQILGNTKTALQELIEREKDVARAASVLTDIPGVRIMTIHKSKGLEFDSVIILGVENETFWGNAEDERCAFFVGISRAKRQLVLTHSTFRKPPPGAPRRWSEQRSPHEEFLSYATPYVTSEPTSVEQPKDVGQEHV